MRFLTLLILCLFYAAPAFAVEETRDSETSRRTYYAVELLRKTCLMHFGDRAALMSALDEKYERASPEKAQRELDFVYASAGGDVWVVVKSPKVRYTIVSETNGNCHLLTEHNDSTLLHKYVKNLAVDVRDSRSFTVVDYKGVPEDAKLVKTSEFVMKAPDGGVIMTVKAATKDDAKTELADVVLSVFKPHTP